MPWGEEDGIHFCSICNGHQARKLWLSSSCGSADIPAQAAAAADHVLVVDECVSVMQASPSLVEMTRNPFILRLFVDALPAMKTSGVPLRRITRYDVFRQFEQQWFEREVARLSRKRRFELGVGEDGNAAPVVELFELLCALLAGEMLKSNALMV